MMSFLSDGRYYVIQQDDLANMTEEVREYLLCGWTPTGGISTDGQRFYQAMMTTDAAMATAEEHWLRVVAAEMARIDEERPSTLSQDLIREALRRLGDKVPKNFVAEGIREHFLRAKQSRPFEISNLAQDPT